MTKETWDQEYKQLSKDLDELEKEMLKVNDEN